LLAVAGTTRWKCEVVLAYAFGRRFAIGSNFGVWKNYRDFFSFVGQLCGEPPLTPKDANSKATMATEKSHFLRFPGEEGLLE